LHSLSITSKEMKVVGLLRNGFTADDIARELNVSVQTVYGIYAKIKEKVGVSHISEVVKFAEVNALLV
jgi:DNA-binding NarL/FixJ family response regulator